MIKISDPYLSSSKKPVKNFRLSVNVYRILKQLLLMMVENRPGSPLYHPYFLISPIFFISKFQPLETEEKVQYSDEGSEVANSSSKHIPRRSRSSIIQQKQSFGRRKNLRPKKID